MPHRTYEEHKTGPAKLIAHAHDHKLDKHCVTCGRAFTWRKKWARDWSAIKHCSRKCRSIRLDEVDDTIERQILQCMVLTKRLESSTFIDACRDQLGDLPTERIKAAARRLANHGHVTWYKDGRRQDPSKCTGRFELRR